jgi:hypothetical protein
MIECLFTIDYEIYGNGSGSLREHVFEPCQRLKEILDGFNAKMVLFVEVAELEAIEAAGSDPSIADVKRQVREMYNQGHEIALHLHPQWCNARRVDETWKLDYSEYNLCSLPEQRIAEIVDRSIGYLRTILSAPDFSPLSFRAGNWLFQPTQTAAKVLAERGIKIDSSVFKGGLQRRHKLDYRRALSNGYYWKFGSDVTAADPSGTMLELPIYTEMVPFWKMATAKRTGFRSGGGNGTPVSLGAKINKFLDRARLFYPLKFDFCRMTLDELTSMVDGVIKMDRGVPSYKPLVAIGHTKDLVDFDTVRQFLSFLKENGIPVSTFENVTAQCR